MTDRVEMSMSIREGVQFDLVAHLKRQRAFSRGTFGPGMRTAGVLDHIRKECAEIEKDPADLFEWVDLILLAFDGAWRAGHSPEAIAMAIDAKQGKNELRDWPDWRTADPNKAIEHVRAGASPAVIERTMAENSGRACDGASPGPSGECVACGAVPGQVCLASPMQPSRVDHVRVERRETFTVPPGHVAITNADGRFTGETREHTALPCVPAKRCESRRGDCPSPFLCRANCISDPGWSGNQESGR